MGGWTGQAQEAVEEAQATGQLRQIQEDLLPHSGQLHPAPDLLQAALAPQESGASRILHLIYALQVISSYDGISDDETCALAGANGFVSDPDIHLQLNFWLLLPLYFAHIVVVSSPQSPPRFYSGLSPSISQTINSPLISHFRVSPGHPSRC